MERLIQDVRYALRLLARSRAFTATAVATIALAIGANTALFSVVDAVLLRPLPFRDPDRLVRIWEANPGMNLPYFSVSWPNFGDWARQSRSFEATAAMRRARRNVTGPGDPEAVDTAAATSSFFGVLGVSPVHGRAFTPDEDGAGAPRVVVIGHGLWQRRFAGDPGVLGRTLVLDGQPHEVVGVLPRAFEFGRVEAWTPLVPTPDMANRRQHVLGVIARLAPGATLEGARTELATIAGRLEQQYPDSNRGWTSRIETVADWILDPPLRRGLVILLGAVGCVLLIACANLASLQLARAGARQRELAVRAAIGASRMRLGRQLLTESVLVAIAGGAIGFGLAFWAVDALRRLGPANLPRLDQATVDLRVLAFTAVVSVLAGILFGLPPALQGSRDAADALREGGRTVGVGAGRRRLRRVLVVGEVAVTLVLLVGAGLLIRSFAALQAVPLGFAPGHVVTAQLNTAQERFRDDARRTSLYAELLRRLQALPGLETVALTNIAPFGGGNSGIDLLPEERLERPEGAAIAADWRAVSADYFRALRVPLLAGRTFAVTDTKDAPCVIVVSRHLAETAWPAKDPLGRRARAGGANQGLCTVIGVVANVRAVTLDTEPRPALYIAATQFPPAPATLVIRSAIPSEAIIAAARREVAAVDPELPLAAVRTLDQLVHGAAAQPRFHTLLLALMAGLSLVLAIVGLYGLLSIWVGERTREFGIRLAVGAVPRQLLSLVLGQGMRLALVGLMLGLPAAWAASRLLQTLLFGVTGTDPVTYVVTCALLAGTAALACAIPARRAARVEPSEALRYE